MTENIDKVAGAGAFAKEAMLVLGMIILLRTVPQSEHTEITEWTEIVEK